MDRDSVVHLLPALPLPTLAHIGWNRCPWETDVRISGMVLGVVLGLAATVGHAGNSNPLGRYAETEEFLPGELAFRASMMTGRNGEIIVRWDMPEGYYLYKNKMKFDVVGGLRINRVIAPAGLVKNDEFLGRVEVYRDSVSVVLDRQGLAGGALKVAYQGCAEDKMCYPPMTRLFSVPAAGQCGKANAGSQGAC